VDRRDQGALIWLLAAACLLFGFFGFAVAVPWTFSVTTIGDAARDCPGAIDPSWPAVVCNHGRPGEWKYGLIEDHPIRYAAAWLELIVGWGMFFYLAMRLKRFR
jgi:hypothetical protein